MPWDLFGLLKSNSRPANNSEAKNTVSDEEHEFPDAVPEFFLAAATKALQFTFDVPGKPYSYTVREGKGVDFRFDAKQSSVSVQNLRTLSVTTKCGLELQKPERTSPMGEDSDAMGEYRDSCCQRGAAQTFTLNGNTIDGAHADEGRTLPDAKVDKYHSSYSSMYNYLTQSYFTKAGAFHKDLKPFIILLLFSNDGLLDILATIGAQLGATDNLNFKTSVSECRVNFEGLGCLSVEYTWRFSLAANTSNYSGQQEIDFPLNKIFVTFALEKIHKTVVTNGKSEKKFDKQRLLLTLTTPCVSKKVDEKILDRWPKVLKNHYKAFLKPLKLEISLDDDFFEDIPEAPYFKYIPQDFLDITTKPESIVTHSRSTVTTEQLQEIIDKNEKEYSGFFRSFRRSDLKNQLRSLVTLLRRNNQKDLRTDQLEKILEGYDDSLLCDADRRLKETALKTKRTPPLTEDKTLELLKIEKNNEQKLFSHQRTHRIVQAPPQDLVYFQIRKHILGLFVLEMLLLSNTRSSESIETIITKTFDELIKNDETVKRYLSKTEVNLLCNGGMGGTKNSDRDFFDKISELPNLLPKPNLLPNFNTTKISIGHQQKLRKLISTCRSTAANLATCINQQLTKMEKAVGIFSHFVEKCGFSVDHPFHDYFVDFLIALFYSQMGEYAFYKHVAETVTKTTNIEMVFPLVYNQNESNQVFDLAEESSTLELIVTSTYAMGMKLPEFEETIATFDGESYYFYCTGTIETKIIFNKKTNLLQIVYSKFPKIETYSCAHETESAAPAKVSYFLQACALIRASQPVFCPFQFVLTPIIEHHLKVPW